MKFLVLVPVYGRYDILKLFAEGLNVLKDQGYDIEVLAVGSSTEVMFNFFVP